MLNKTGYWLELDDCMTICSECNSLGCNSNYCPNCGAKMLAAYINENCPDSREKSLAMAKLEECAARNE